MEIEKKENNTSLVRSNNMGSSFLRGLHLKERHIDLLFIYNKYLYSSERKITTFKESAAYYVNNPCFSPPRFHVHKAILKAIKQTEQKRA